MKTYYLNNQKNLVNDTRISKKSRLLRLINDKYLDALERALEKDDARRVNNIVNDFSTEIYKSTGVWFDEFDYYYEYNDNLNGYISLMIYRLNKVFS